MRRWAPISEEGLSEIHLTTLRVLEETGIRLTQPEGREILGAGGGRIEGDRVKIPAELAEQSLRQCPSTVAIRGRGGWEARLGHDGLHWHNLGGARAVYDDERHRHREAMVQDVRDSARLLDALDGATTVTPFFTPQDVPGPIMSLAMYRHSLSNTTKPLHGPGVQSAAEVRIIADMVEVFGDPSEHLTLAVSPLSPLTFPDQHVEAMIEAARLDIPFGPLPCPIAGATAPLSIAGALVQQNAELLGSIVLLQLIRPGLPIFYCGRIAFIEPRTGLAVGSCPEAALASATTVQLGHRYGLPVNVYGLATNANGLDLQNGFERCLNALLPALAGADELSGIGETSGGVAGSYAQMVCDSEIAATVRRVIRGVNADERSLASQVIHHVVEGPGNFLGESHTVDMLEAGELLIPELADRRSMDVWEAQGGTGIVDRARAVARQILQEHEVEPLDAAQERELDRILAAAEHTLG
jgi:trimethylamine--corrinoid protein Co-methyltransferase